MKAKKKENKFKDIQVQYKNEQKELNDARDDILKIENEIRRKVNKIADLKGILALKLAEREKVQY